MNQAPVGLARRLARLRRGEIYSILALDHGLTSGVIDGLEDISCWSKFADDVGIASVVVNIGALRKLPVSRKHAVILQTMGSPNILGTKSRRVVNTSVEEALCYDADAVAVQINLTGSDLEQTIAAIASVRMDAHRVGLPVLFMITTPKDGFKDMKEILDAIRVCDELGADLIKTVSECTNENSNADLSYLKSAVPIVLAGGEASEKFETILRTAKSLRFAGYCIGRNVFQSHQPQEVIDRIHEALK